MKNDGPNCAVCLCVASHRCGAFLKGAAVAAGQWRCEEDASVPPGDGCAAEDALPAAGASRACR